MFPVNLQTDFVRTDTSEPRRLFLQHNWDSHDNHVIVQNLNPKFIIKQSLDLSIAF